MIPATTVILRAGESNSTNVILRAATSFLDLLAVFGGTGRLLADATLIPYIAPPSDFSNVWIDRVLIKRDDKARYRYS